MKKLILPLIILSLLFGTVVLAQNNELSSAGLTPDSPFYFLDTLGEKIGMFFTFGDLKKAVRYTTLATERVVEAKAMVEKEKPKLAEKTLKRYEDQLRKALARTEKAKVKGKSIEKVTETIAEATGKHLIVLEEVLEKVPEEAKEVIAKAKEVSVTGQKNALKALARENPEEATEINLKAVKARLNRANLKAEEGETKEVEEAIEEFKNRHKFGEEISQIAQGLGKDTTIVEQLVGKATSIHLEILAEVYEKVPEQAKPVIERAMTVSAKGHEKAVQVLKEKNALEGVPEEAPMPEEVPEEVKERIREGIVVGGPCSYDKFKGGCKITSIINESIIKFKFTPAEPIDIEWAKESIAREREVYASNLGWKCLEKDPITKEDLEKCGIKENAALDCELEIITSGTCTPIIFKFHEPSIKEEEEKECISGKTKPYVCPDGTEVSWCGCIDDKWVCIISPEVACECIGKGGETFAGDPNCCEGLKMVAGCLPDQPCPISLRYCVDCGNGVCDAYENWYNCKEDCLPNCGNDICEEGVCQAIGCPDPETPENCPKDCLQGYELIKKYAPECIEAGAIIPDECAKFYFEKMHSTPSPQIKVESPSPPPLPE